VFPSIPKGEIVGSLVFIDFNHGKDMQENTSKDQE
jgi:hypothetical protein